MLFALIACAAVGLVLGTRCRLLPLVVASAFVATSVSMVLLANGSGLAGFIRLVGLLAVLQACYLVGALLRVSGRGAPQHRWFPLWFSAVPRAYGR
jgi:hypothetical protein